MEKSKNNAGASTRAAFGWQTTTEDVLDGIDLSAKTALVTGATSGIGSETARALAAHKVSVIITARSTEKAVGVVEMIREKTGKNVIVEELELGSMASIRAFADRILARGARIDYLINNAGLAGLPFLEKTVDGFEMHFGVNHLGHFLMTNLIAPALANGGRVVSLSSAGHRRSPVVFDDINFENRPYTKSEAYGQSKSANILFAVGINARLASRGIEAFAVHPGGIRTELNRHMTEADLARFDSMDIKWKSMEQGAATSVFAATAPELAGKGGAYLGDCNVWPINDDDKDILNDGVKSWAIDEQEAERLWAISEEMVGQVFAY